MRVIPLAAIPSQTLAIILDGQNASISLRQNGPNMYFSLQADGVAVVTSRICRDAQLLLVDAHYRGFLGDFLFVDLQDAEQPFFTGLGTRFVLVFLSDSEVPVPVP